MSYLVSRGIKLFNGNISKNTNCLKKTLFMYMNALDLFEYKMRDLALEKF